MSTYADYFNEHYQGDVPSGPVRMIISSNDQLADNMDSGSVQAESCTLEELMDQEELPQSAQQKSVESLPRSSLNLGWIPSSSTVWVLDTYVDIFTDCKQCTASYSRTHQSIVQGRATRPIAKYRDHSAHLLGCALCGAGRIGPPEVVKQTRKWHVHRIMFALCEPLDPHDCTDAKVYADNISRCVASSPMGPPCANYVIYTLSAFSMLHLCMLTLDK